MEHMEIKLPFYQDIIKMNKDPRTWILLDWALILLLPIIGGFVNVAVIIRQDKLRHKRYFEIIVFALCEAIISAFVGVIVFFIMFDRGATLLEALSLGGLCGNLGARFLFLLKSKVESNISKLLDIKTGTTICPYFEKEKNEKDKID